MTQKEIRKLLKIEKMNDNSFTFGELAEMIDIKTASFYNWLNGAYHLSESKQKQLQNWLCDRLDYQQNYS